MKYINLFILIACLMASCTTDLELEITRPVDFNGTYAGSLDCIGDLTEANGDEIMVYITSSPITSEYFVAVGEDEDDLVFSATASGNELTIEEQTLNEEFDFDVVTLAGTITMNGDDTFQFVFEHEVDDEGTSTCDITLEKQ